MKIEVFEQTVTEALDKSKQTLTAKRNEYSRNNNVFHNFEKAKQVSLHESKEAVAWEFMVKHLQSLRDMINDVENNNYKYINKPLIDEKCIDIINYTLLIRGMLIERSEEV